MTAWIYVLFTRAPDRSNHKQRLDISIYATAVLVTLYVLQACCPGFDKIDPPRWPCS